MSTEATQEQTTPEVETPEVNQQAEAAGEQPAAEEQAQEQEAAPVQSDDDAFMAGFNQANGIEPEAKENKPEPEPESKQLIAGMTEDQLKELLEKAAEVDKLREQQAKVFGSLGSLKQSIDQLRNQPRPTATAVQVTKEKLKRLSETFPEMAEMIAEDLNGVLAGGAPASVDPAQFEELVEQKLSTKLQQTQQQFEARVLSVMHPDWKTVVPSPEFNQWKQSLPEEVREELDSSWDAEFIGSKLSEFKDWKSKTAASQQAKQRRLEAAIAPRGSAQPPAQSDDDAFIAGFKQARGIK